MYYILKYAKIIGIILLKILEILLFEGDKMIELIKAGLFESGDKFKDLEITPERKVYYYEIELYVAGEGKTYIDGKSYPHEKGNFIFAKPGKSRHSEKNFVCFYIHIRVGKKEKELLNDVLTFSKVSNYQLYKNAYTEIIRLYEGESKNREFLLQSKIYEFLDIILNESKLKSRIKNVGTKISPEAVQKAVKFIDENFQSRIVLKDVADAVNFSPVYFHKCFTSSTGKTPHEYITEKRLEAAKTYLLTTSNPMSKIVDMCGFSSISYFDYIFKKAYGMTPSQFRQKKYVI